MPGLAGEGLCSTFELSVLVIINIVIGELAADIWGRVGPRLIPPVCSDGAQPLAGGAQGHEERAEWGSRLMFQGPRGLSILARCSGISWIKHKGCACLQAEGTRALALAPM